jgi:hypothetical protein
MAEPEIDAVDKSYNIDKSQKKIKLGFYIFVVIICIMVYLHYYNLTQNIVEDSNKDGLIDTDELNSHIKKEIEKRQTQPPQFKGIVKSSVTGLLRGLLMGLVLGGVEGALTTGIVLATINPIISGVEYYI